MHSACRVAHRTDPQVEFLASWNSSFHVPQLACPLVPLSPFPLSPRLSPRGSPAPLRAAGRSRLCGSFRIPHSEFGYPLGAPHPELSHGQWSVVRCPWSILRYEHRIPHLVSYIRTLVRSHALAFHVHSFPIRHLRGAVVPSYLRTPLPSGVPASQHSSPDPKFR